MTNQDPVQNETVARLARMLSELAQMTGDDVDPLQPVLTMELDGIVTLSRVALDEREGKALLTISALLPPLAHPPALALTLADGVIGPDSALLWDHNGQRHVIVRWLPAGGLRDERGLLDAVMETADLARAWHRQACAVAPAVSG